MAAFKTGRKNYMFDKPSVWNNWSRILFVTVLLLGALAAWLYLYYAESLRDNILQLEDRGRDNSLENERLREHVGYLTQRLEEEVAKVSAQKEAEMAKMKATHDEMVNAMKKEIEQGQIKVTQLADRLSLNIVDKILFPSGEAEFSDQGKEVLMRVGGILKQAQDKTIRIEGHTDTIPISKHLQSRFASNWELSTARATNVVRFLQDEAGIDPASLEAVGLGQFHPIANNKTVKGRSQNRRIEIILSPRVHAPAKASGNRTVPQ